MICGFGGDDEPPKTCFFIMVAHSRELKWIGPLHGDYRESTGYLRRHITAGDMIDRHSADGGGTTAM